MFDAPSPAAFVCILQVAMPWAGLKQELEKKTTFESACAKTISILTEDPARTADAGLRALLRRVRTLLRSRHSSPAFWHKGRQLFHAAEGLTADAGLRAELAEFVAECDAFLGAHSTSSDAAAGEQAGQQWEGQQQGRSGSAQPFLFEGQISAESPPRPAGLLDAILHIAARVQQQQQQHQEQQQQQQQEHQEQEGREGQHTVGGSGQGQGDDPSAAAAATGLPGLTPEMMETMQQELDAIAVELMEESGQQVPRPAPPASKRVLRQLPREALTPERLEELGGPGVRCPVCM